MSLYGILEFLQDPVEAQLASTTFGPALLSRVTNSLSSSDRLFYVCQAAFIAVAEALRVR